MKSREHEKNNILTACTKDYQRQIQVTKTKIQTTVNRMLNTKYAALSLTEASIQKNNCWKTKSANIVMSWNTGLLATVKTVLFCEDEENL